ncbi:SpoIIE family protein phosphatase [Streptomyces sp. NPDC057794]|uniref:SpoIIE family protein phosphatase n=1 Tax=Streptomyces sp. NPDC057794 TaxID=3346251 RepID=UPI0036782D73
MPRVWDIPVRDATRVRDARVAAEQAAALAGLDERRTAAAALVATELATNLLKHAEGGQVLIDVVDPPVLRDGREESRVVQIAAIDHGPGIRDVPAAVRDGFSTTRSLGAGLGTCRRLADDFGLHSTPGRGTVAVARVGSTPRTGAVPAGTTAAAWPDGGVAGRAVPPDGDPWTGPDDPVSRDEPGPGGAPRAASAPLAAMACGGLTGHAGAPGLAGRGASPTSRNDAAPTGSRGRPGTGAAPDPSPAERGGPAGHALREAPARAPRDPLARVRAGGVNIPYGGAEYSGDAWTCVRSGERVTLMLADGLGHGPEAARASSAAVAALHRWAHLSPAEALRHLHEALRGTRGAAVALAQLDLRAGLLKFAGIGNVGARLRADGSWRALLSRPGIVGVHRPTTLREEEARWAADRLLILHTDGLPSRWTPPDDSGAPAADPAVTAAVTIRDASSPARPVRDDTAVAVLTPTPPERP